MGIPREHKYFSMRKCEGEKLLIMIPICGLARALHRARKPEKKTQLLKSKPNLYFVSADYSKLTGSIIKTRHSDNIVGLLQSRVNFPYLDITEIMYGCFVCVLHKDGHRYNDAEELKVLLQLPTLLSWRDSFETIITQFQEGA